MARGKILYQFSASPKFMVSKMPSSVTSAGLRLALVVNDYFNPVMLATPAIPNDKLCQRAGLTLRSLQRGRNQLIKAGVLEAEQVDSNSGRWIYKFTDSVLGLEAEPAAELTDQTAEEGCDTDVEPKKTDDTDVVSNDNPVAPDDNPVALDEVKKRFEKLTGVRVPANPKKPAEKGIRISSLELSIKRESEQQEIGETRPQDLGLRPDLGSGANKVEELVEKMIGLEQDWGLDEDDRNPEFQGATDDLFWLLVSEIVEWNEQMIEGSKLLFAATYDQPDYVKQRWLAKRGAK